MAYRYISKTSVVLESLVYAGSMAIPLTEVTVYTLYSSSNFLPYTRMAQYAGISLEPMKVSMTNFMLRRLLVLANFTVHRRYRFDRKSLLALFNRELSLTDVHRS